MITPAVAKQRSAESLNGFPPTVVSAYLAFAERGDPVDLDIVVLGVLQFYIVKKPGTPLIALPGSTRLVEDLGCDSLTMMDTVFMVESLLDVKLDDAELPKLKTLDDLRNYLRQLVVLTAVS
ncbi:MAG: acyl carrier protein [Opitutaceae bacterium]